MRWKLIVHNSRDKMKNVFDDSNELSHEIYGLKLEINCNRDVTKNRYFNTRRDLEVRHNADSDLRVI